MADVVNGTLGPIQQPDRVEFSPQQGRQVWAVYQSADSSMITAAREGYEADGKTCRSYGDGAVFTVEVLQGNEDSENTALQDTWAVVANELQRGDKQSPAWLALSATVQQEHIDFLELGKKPSETGYAVSSLQYFFYKRAYYNADTFSTSQYVLRHTTIASPDYGGNVSDANVESLYTTSELIDEITDSGLWVNPCPGRLVAKIESIPVPADVNADDANFYLWSWRKLPSTEETQPDGNISINTEYWLGMWPTPHYSIA